MSCVSQSSGDDERGIGDDRPEGPPIESDEK